MENEFELIVTKSTVGVLETNIAALEKFVEKALENYTVEKYLGDADAAKKDRAELNKSKKFLADKRKSIIDELMKPYSDFETRCKKLEKDIDKASAALDAIVKEKEGSEKSAKRAQVESLWEQKQFLLFPLEKIWNEKWLNKGYKISDIDLDMKAAIKKFYDGLKIIEKAVSEDDAETVKSYYLDCLDVEQALSYAATLVENRKKVAEEKEARAGREHEEVIEKQRTELQKESEAWRANRTAAALAAQVLGEEDTAQVDEYVFTIKATEVSVLGIRNFLTAQGFEFEWEKLDF